MKLKLKGEILKLKNVSVSRWRRILGIQSLSLTYGRQKLNLWVAVSPPEAPSGVKKEAALFQRFNDRSVVVI